MNDIVLITGASSGIGYETSELLTKEGYTVYGIGREFTKSVSFEKIVCDITDTPKLLKILDDIKKVGDIKALINNAAIAYYGTHEQLTPTQISQMVRTNLEAPLILSSRLINTLAKTKGIIINISSVTAKSVNPHGCAYGATKAALTSFSESLFQEVRKRGIRVTTLHPDMTDTQLYRNADFKASNEEGAYLTPKDIAETILCVLKNENMVLTDITIKPQYHKIAKK
ncbi:MAG: SDR family oxidoreductase [Firmicutes bacterium]|nr:SDR family oxidoreductase [Bacillota bacterium]